MTEPVVTIYGLKDPYSRKIRYIGQTANVRRRLLEHLHDSTDAWPKSDKEEWITNLVDEGRAPEMVVLETVDPSEANAAERQWIHYGLTQGWDLYNVLGNQEFITDFGAWLTDEMGRRGWSQVVLSSNTGISTGQVSRILSNERNPGADSCTAIATAFGVPPDDVFRRAGLLPPKREPSGRQRAMLAMLDSLSDSAIETLMDVANALMIREQVGNRTEAT